MQHHFRRTGFKTEATARGPLGITQHLVVFDKGIHGRQNATGDGGRFRIDIGVGFSHRVQSKLNAFTAPPSVAIDITNIKAEVSAQPRFTTEVHGEEADGATDCAGVDALVEAAVAIERIVMGEIAVLAR